MKRIKIMGVFVYAIIIGLNASAQFAGGNGSPRSPYQIANASQLQYLSDRMLNDTTNYNTAYYVLTADVDMNTATNQWTWCGNYNSSTFAVATGSTQTSNFVPIGHDVGGLIGDPGDEATSVYEKCYSTYCDIYGTQYVGGLFGGGNAAFTIRNCYSSLCKVSGTANIAGLLGYGGACYVQNSYGTNVVLRRASTTSAGGLGTNLTNASRITNSYYIDTFKGSGSWTPNGDANRGISYTSTQMLVPTFVNTLNNSQNPQIWFQDTSLYVNGGYPVLAVSRGREGTTYQIGLLMI